MILSTIHSAKGQEWGAVQILNVVDGCIPSEMSTGDARQIAEERRLLYVGMTRAKQHLELLAPQRFFVSEQARAWATGTCMRRCRASSPTRRGRISSACRRSGRAGAEGAAGRWAVPDVQDRPGGARAGSLGR